MLAGIHFRDDIQCLSFSPVLGPSRLSQPSGLRPSRLVAGFFLSCPWNIVTRDEAIIIHHHPRHGSGGPASASSRLSNKRIATFLPGLMALARVASKPPNCPPMSSPEAGAVFVHVNLLIFPFAAFGSIVIGTRTYNPASYCLHLHSKGPS